MSQLRKSLGAVRVQKNTKHADINTIKGLNWSDSIEFIRQRYEKIPVKYRDPRAGQALRDLEFEAPSKQHLIEFFITLWRAGFLGIEVSQDLLAGHISRITHAHRFGDRTLRNAVKWAEEQGYISTHWAPIGIRVKLPSDEYRTIKIRRYTATNKIRLLVAVLRQDPNRFKPELTIVTNITDSPNVVKIPTPEKIADNPKGELPTGGQLDDPPVGKLLVKSISKENSGVDLIPREGGNEVSAFADISTCPERSGATAPTCEHARKNQRSPARAKAPQKRAPASGRRGRVSKSYAAARKALLHELFLALKTFGNAETCYNIAALQTDPAYPDCLPSALDWDEIIITTYFDNWHGRRKTLDRVVIPALRQFEFEWTPPAVDPSSREGQRALEDWENMLLPESGIVVRAVDLPDYRAQWRFVRPWLSAIHAGRTKWGPETLKQCSFIRRFCDFLR